MRIARLPTYKPQYRLGAEGPQVKKFEQVSSDGHQMSLARERLGSSHV